MTQQLSPISEIKLKLPKNAKLFFHNDKGLYFLVHYDHVILTLANTIPKRVLSCYGASPSSNSAIFHVLNVYDIKESISSIYEKLGKTDADRKSNRNDYKRSGTGDNYGSWSPRILKAEWSDRISALENYDYKKGNYLWQ